MADEYKPPISVERVRGLRQLADLDTSVLKQIVVGSIVEFQQRYG